MESTAAERQAAAWSKTSKKWSSEESLPYAVKALSPRALTIGYSLALLVVASLSIASHITLAVVLHANAGSAALMNMSGRQRMLSQRIVSLAAEYEMGDGTVRPALISAIDEFDRAETILSEASRDPPNTTAARQLRAVYFGDPDSLEFQVRDFVADARSIVARPPACAAMPPPLRRIAAQARDPLLNSLNEIVLIHQREIERIFKRLEWLQWSMLGAVLLTLGIEALTFFRLMVKQIVLHTGVLLRLVTTDALTGLSNRRGFLDACKIERSRSWRHARPITLMMLDIDHFKTINDTHGHQAGDEVLRRLASELRSLLRMTDVVARIGGEEFAVLMPETDLVGARILAERLRDNLASSIVLFRDAALRFTVSIGVTSMHDSGAETNDILHFADGLMYQAKQNGRDCIVDAPPPAG